MTTLVFFDGLRQFLKFLGLRASGLGFLPGKLSGLFARQGRSQRLKFSSEVVCVGGFSFQQTFGLRID